MTNELLELDIQPQNCIYCDTCMFNHAISNTTKSIVYEVHVTVSNAMVMDFFNACINIGVKPIILELQTKDSKKLFDMMTSSVVKDESFNKAYDEAYRIKDELEKLGFNVIRVKIETVPWHPLAQKNISYNQYFETHFPLVLNDDNENSARFYCEQNNLHISRNTFKKLENNNRLIMATYRTRDCVRLFLNRTDQIKNDLITLGISMNDEKVISEFAIYDTLIKHDDKWTGVNIESNK